MSIIAEEYSFPVLSGHYASALREAVEYISGRYDVCGMVVAGTIIYGTADPSSDFDFHVLHRACYRQRVQKFFQGVPAEIFLNPPGRVLQYFEDERDRPCTAHMYASGFVMYDPEGLVADLREKAVYYLSLPREVSERSLTLERYMLANRFEDGLDLAVRDPEGALLLLGQVLPDMLAYYFTRRGCVIPRGKDLLMKYREMEPASGELVGKFLLSEDYRTRIASAEHLADSILGTRGFFEWESDIEEVVS